MALLDAGVPLKRPVAGISVGLVTELDETGKITKYKRLLDIIGTEDFFGDMDFKLCGTSEGVTGYQLDLKLPGLPLEILTEAIDKAKEARTKILDVMDEAIAAPDELSKYAPRIETVKIDPDRIGELIGPGGKNIKGIQAESGAEINIEDDGTVHIYATKPESLERCEGDDREHHCRDRDRQDLHRQDRFDDELRRLHGSAARQGRHDPHLRTRQLPGRGGRGRRQVGDRVIAKCIGVDDKKRVKMSRKAALEEKGEPQTEPTYEIGERKPRRDDDRGGRGGDRRGGDRRGGGGGRGRRDRD